ncbi:BA14K family protein [Afifella sp. IM 167]|uniref:BA14K family protein n=1 Tax=Afifella sp. IM 167 TaxID=2033586 RepID=UPI001CCC1276|nr:BA14K family protein [Afifella sp. IM 167]
MKKLTHRAGLTALAASIVLTMAPIAAGAAPLMPNAMPGASDVVQIQGERWMQNRPGARTERFGERSGDRTRHRDSRASNHWDRNRHGPRYRNRRNGYTHYHDGYYYATPWWLAAGAIGAFIGAQTQPNRGGERAHDDWCSQRYKSYNRRSNTFLGYDGRRHACNSPYDNR